MNGHVHMGLDTLNVRTSLFRSPKAVDFERRLYRLECDDGFFQLTQPPLTVWMQAGVTPDSVLLIMGVGDM